MLADSSLIVRRLLQGPELPSGNLRLNWLWSDSDAVADFTSTVPPGRDRRSISSSTGSAFRQASPQRGLTGPAAACLVSATKGPVSCDSSSGDECGSSQRKWTTPFSVVVPVIGSLLLLRRPRPVLLWVRPRAGRRPDPKASPIGTAVQPSPGRGCPVADGV